MSRRKKKAIKNSMVIYDVKSIPRNVSLEKIIEVFHETGFVLYDSVNAGSKPQITGRNKKGVNIIDVSRNYNLKI